MLQLHFENLKKAPLWLVEPKYTLGTDSNCSITVSGEGIESRHGILEVMGDKLMMTLHSTEGNVRVNGRSVTGAVALAHGDQVKFGDAEFKLVDPKLLPSTVFDSSNGSDNSSEPSVHSDTWTLKAKNAALSNKIFTLLGVQVLGRSKECDISLNLAYLSRQHARLTVTNDGVRVEDLGSVNGTYVNGKRIEQATLTDGDELSFDTLKFVVCGSKLEQDLDKTTIRVIPQALLEAQFPSSEKLSDTSVREAAKGPYPHALKRAPKKSLDSEDVEEKSGGQVSKISAMEAVDEHADLKAMAVSENTSSRKGVISTLLVLCVIMAGVWWFYSQ